MFDYCAVAPRPCGSQAQINIWNRVLKEGDYPRLWVVGSLLIFALTPMTASASEKSANRGDVPGVMLQIRTLALDGTLRTKFEQWYPGMKPTTKPAIAA